VLTVDELLLEIERKERASSDLLAFAEYMSQFPLRPSQVEYLSVENNVWCAPPQSGKTHAAALRVAFALAKGAKVQLFSYNADSARYLSKRVKTIVESPKYKALFPHVGPPELVASPVGQPMYEFAPDLVVIDEPIDRRSDDAANPTKLKRLKSWLRTDVLPACSNVILSCHRTSAGDMTTMLPDPIPLIHAAEGSNTEEDPIRWRTWYLQNPPSMDCVQDIVDAVPYVPREGFAEYHRNNKRSALTVAHRRAGKTVARVNRLIRAAIECELPSPRYCYLAPYFVQAKDIAWNYLKHYTFPLSVKINESELSVTFQHNGAQIRLYGADNEDRLRGMYFDGVVADEAQDISPSTLTQVILPTLADRKGWLDMSGTPKGWDNLLGVTYKAAKDDPEWFVQVLRASETGILDEDELARMRKLMPQNEYEQEFECSFDAAVTGAYFAQEMKDAQDSGRITSVPYDKALEVHTAWDLGISDSMVIWFFQLVGREVRFIDYYAASGYGLDHYAAELRKRKYNYGFHYGPHDVMVRELGTGKSRKEVAFGLGLDFTPAPNLAVKDGIDAARIMLPRCWFDAEKTAKGLDALRQYQEKINKTTGQSMGPLHNWASHPADAFRIAAVCIENPQPRKLELATEWGRVVGGWMG
jgi:hypothetical protein